MFKASFSIIVFVLMVKFSAGYDCVEYIPGDTNLIITVPHGGYHVIGTCPIRKDGCLDQFGNCYYDSSADCDRNPICESTTVLDTDTQEIGIMLGDHVEQLLGSRPHLVIMKCSRKSVDVNRERNEATQSCRDAEAAFDSFHGSVQTIIKSFNGERGLLLDFHGQSHHQNSTEFGYAIFKEDLDATVTHPELEFPSGSLKDCSITALLSKYTASGYTAWDVIGGSQSFGQELENQGFASLPGPRFPVPGQTNYKYFNGGYIVRTYGSHKPEDTVDAQIFFLDLELTFYAPYFTPS